MKLKKQRSHKVFGWGIFLILISVGVAVAVSGLTRTSPTKQPTPHSKVEPEVQPPASKAVSSTEKPVRLRINKIAVDAAIESVGLTSAGAMDAPKTNEGVGWYKDSALLGQSAFSVLLDGHYGTDKQPGVFYRLNELVDGDEITLMGENGALFSYKIVETERQNLEEIDMKKALYPYREGVQSITIITCEGNYDTSRKTYDKRVVVYAERNTTK